LKTFERQFSIRLSEELLNKTESLIEPIQSSNYGSVNRITRQAVIRMALQKCLEVLEREFKNKLNEGI
jgi:hypothetical protein